MSIIDYSTARPSPSLLKAAGVSAVGRYIGWDSVPGHVSIGKNITKAEADSLITEGISIILAFEYTADAAAKGEDQGAMDGKLAFQQLAALDAPPGMAVYFAVDFDMPDYAPHLADTPKNAMAKLGPVGRYFLAINNLKYPYQVGAYGGYYAIKRLLDAMLVTKAWQTIAWSGGQMDNRVVLYQTTTVPPVVSGGGDLDMRQHAATVLDFGQWPRPSAAPVPPVPVPIPQPATMKGTDMLHIRVTAPASSSPEPSWQGTRTFLYQPGYAPVHIVDSATESAVQAVIPVIQFSWSQYVSIGGL